MITFHDVEQGTEKWLELRADKYTGSNADKLLKFASSYKIVNGIKSRYSVAEITGFQGNFWTKRGHLLEDEAISLYERIKKEEVRRYGFVTNDKYLDCGYSPDGYREDRTIEVKCFSEKLHMQLFNGDIPMKVLAQIHFGLLICEKKQCDLVIYNPRFAKKIIDGEPNVNYDPKKAIKIITIKTQPKIAANFKRILKDVPIHAV